MEGCNQVDKQIYSKNFKASYPNTFSIVLEEENEQGLSIDLKYQMQNIKIEHFVSSVVNASIDRPSIYFDNELPEAAFSQPFIEHHSESQNTIEETSNVIKPTNSHPLQIPLTENVSQSAEFHALTIKLANQEAKNSSYQPVLFINAEGIDHAYPSKNQRVFIPQGLISEIEFENIQSLQNENGCIDDHLMADALEIEDDLKSQSILENTDPLNEVADVISSDSVVHEQQLSQNFQAQDKNVLEFEQDWTELKAEKNVLANFIALEMSESNTMPTQAGESWMLDFNEGSMILDVKQNLSTEVCN